MVLELFESLSGRTDDGQKKITISHSENSSGEVERQTAKILAIFNCPYAGNIPAKSQSN